MIESLHTGRHSHHLTSLVCKRPALADMTGTHNQGLEPLDGGEGSSAAGWWLDQVNVSQGKSSSCC